MAGEKPYESTADAAWAGKVESWAWTNRETDRIKAGDCPHCEHPMTVRYEGSIVTTFALVTLTASRMAAVCNCHFKHPGAPDGVTGCGRRGLVSRP